MNKIEQLTYDEAAANYEYWLGRERKAIRRRFDISTILYWAKNAIRKDLAEELGAEHEVVFGVTKSGDILTVIKVDGYVPFRQKYSLMAKKADDADAIYVKNITDIVPRNFDDKLTVKAYSKFSVAGGSCDNAELLEALLEAKKLYDKGWRANIIVKDGYLNIYTHQIMPEYTKPKRQTVWRQWEAK